MIKDTLTYDIVGSFLRPAEIKDLAIASLVEKEVAHGF